MPPKRQLATSSGSKVVKKSSTSLSKSSSIKKTTTKETMLDKDAWTCIFRQLDIKSLGRTLQVNKIFQKLISEDQIIQQYLELYRPRSYHYFGNLQRTGQVLWDPKEAQRKDVPKLVKAFPNNDVKGGTGIFFINDKMITISHVVDDEDSEKAFLRCWTLEFEKMIWEVDLKIGDFGEDVRNPGAKITEFAEPYLGFQEQIVYFLQIDKDKLLIRQVDLNTGKEGKSYQESIDKEDVTDPDNAGPEKESPPFVIVQNHLFFVNMRGDLNVLSLPNFNFVGKIESASQEEKLYFLRHIAVSRSSSLAPVEIHIGFNSTIYTASWDFATNHGRIRKSTKIRYPRDESEFENCRITFSVIPEDRLIISGDAESVDQRSFVHISNYKTGKLLWQQGKHQTKGKSSDKRHKEEDDDNGNEEDENDEEEDDGNDNDEEEEDDGSEEDDISYSSVPVVFQNKMYFIQDGKTYSLNLSTYKLTKLDEFEISRDSEGDANVSAMQILYPNTLQVIVSDCHGMFLHYFNFEKNK